MWRKNQKSDCFYNKAKINGYRARSAYKLLEIQEKFHIIKSNSFVIDLGCAPGGWIQVAQQFTQNPVYGIDLLPVSPILNSYIGQMDFLDTDKVNIFLQNNKFDVILSDLAPQTSGIRSVDHWRSVELVKSVVTFSKQRMIRGWFIAKLFDGDQTNELIQLIKTEMNVSIFKPKSSRQDSKELFLICKK